MEMHLLAYGLFVFAHVPLSFPAVETGSRTLRPCFFFSPPVPSRELVTKSAKK
jgi:hypothetical protein